MKFIAPIVGLLVVLAGAFSSQAQAFIAAHAGVAAVVAGLGGILAAIAPQPHK